MGKKREWGLGARFSYCGAELLLLPSHHISRGSVSTSERHFSNSRPHTLPLGPRCSAGNLLLRLFSSIAEDHAPVSVTVTNSNRGREGRAGVVDASRPAPSNRTKHLETCGGTGQHEQREERRHGSR